MPAVAEILLFDQVAVRKHHGTVTAVRSDGGPVARQDVGAVQGKRDAAEALRFALGAVVAAGAIQTGERGILLRPDHHFRRDLEPVQGGVERQPIAGEANRSRNRAARPSTSIPTSGQGFAVEHQGLVVVAVSPHRQGAPDPRLSVVYFEREIDALDQERRRLVVHQVDGAGFFVTRPAVPPHPAIQYCEASPSSGKGGQSSQARAISTITKRMTRPSEGGGSPSPCWWLPRFV